MKDHEWAMLFELIAKAINLKGMTASEKGEEIRRQADKVDGLGDLEEFLAECES